MFLKAGMEIYAKQDRIYSENGTETPTPGYVIFNAGLGTDFVRSDGKVIMTLTILGENVTNKAYQSHLSRLKYFEDYPGNLSGRSGIYNMGRNVSIRLTLPLNYSYR